MRYKIQVFFILFSLFCISCEKNDVPAPTMESTVLIYIAADNNLNGDATDNFNAIMDGRGGIPKNSNLIVYLDQKGETPKLIKVDSNGKRTVKEYAEQNSASVIVMQSVIGDMIGMFPAQRYGLILWSHATSWLPVTSIATYSINHPQFPLTKSFGDDIDGGGPREMNLSELAVALPDNLFDYIIFDACYMASVEVVYELRNKADYIMASVAEVIASGLPYDQIIGDLFGFSENSLKTICQKYFDFYNKSPDSRYATTSLIKTAELDNLSDLTKVIITENRNKINNINKNSIQCFDRFSYHIAYDFEQFIETIGLPADFAAFSTQLQDVVVFKAATPRYLAGAINRHCGLAAYIPTTNVSLNEFYKTLEWSKKVYGQ